MESLIDNSSLHDKPHKNTSSVKKNGSINGEENVDGNHYGEAEASNQDNF